MEYSILQSAQMDESIDSRKQMDLTQLTHHFKIYKQTYHKRPIPVKNLQTYLQLTTFISQLAPTCFSHYADTLNKEENNFITTEIIMLFDDILNKLKNIAEKLEKKENQDNQPKNSTEICRTCLHNLRTVEATTIQEGMRGQSELSKNIFKLMKDIEEDGGTFTDQEDRQFFKELQRALEKKQQVLQICSTEGKEFTKFIEQQLKQLMAAKELFILQAHVNQQNLRRRGPSLKQEMSESIKQHMNSKIPQIVSNLTKRIRLELEDQRKSTWVNAETQTVEIQNNKVSQLKRKLAQIQLNLSASVQQKQKLLWTINEKDIRIKKIEHELQALKDEFNKNSHQMQKEMKSLDEYNKRYKEQLERQRPSRRDIFQKQSGEGSIRTLKSLHKLKEITSIQQESIKQTDNNKDNNQSKQKERRTKRITNLNHNRSSSKFVLPNINKIKRMESQIISSIEFHEQKAQKTQKTQKSQVNETLKIQIVKESDKEEVEIDQGSKKSDLSRSSLQKKGKNQLKKLLNMVPVGKENKSSSPQVSTMKDKNTIKNDLTSPRPLKDKQTSHSKDKYATISTQQPQRHLPLISQRSLKKEDSRNQSITPITPDSTTTQPLRQTNYRESVEGPQYMNDKPIEKKLSRTSILQSINHQNREHRKGPKQQFDKSSHTERNENPTLYKEQKTQKDNVKPNNQIGDQTFMVTHPQQNHPNSYSNNLVKILANSHANNPKSYLHNSYSKINEQIDKQNSLTPALGTQAPSFITPAQSHAKINTSIEQQPMITSSNLQQLSTITPPHIQGHSIQSIITRPHIQHSSALQSEICRLSIQSKEFKGKKSQDQKQMIKIDTRVNRGSHKNRSQDNSLQHARQSPKSKAHTKKNIPEINGNLEHLKLGFTLFIDQARAHFYESSFSKRNRKPIVLNNEQHNYLAQVFKKLQDIKHENIQLYQQICSYLRYPFSSSQQGCCHIDFIQTISLSFLIHFFQKIIPLHKKCKTEAGLCHHLTNFSTCISDFLKTSA